jgi:hypothetical protein
MPRYCNGERSVRAKKRDAGEFTGRSGATLPHRRRTEWPPIPDLFDVITYFRARGDRIALIASIGFASSYGMNRSSIVGLPPRLRLGSRFFWGRCLVAAQANPPATTPTTGRRPAAIVAIGASHARV